LLATSHDRLGSTGEKTGFWLELASTQRIADITQPCATA
jgi:hypothetical protein